MKNEESPIIQIANPKQITKLSMSVDELKKFAEGKNIKVDYELNQRKEPPYNTIGSVRLRCRRIEIEDCKWFAEVSRLADNVSMTPYLDGTFDYCLTFSKTLVTFPDEEV